MDDDRIREGLDLAADHIDVGDPNAALDGVHAARQRRRRRRTAFAGVGVAALLVGGVATVVTLDDAEGDEVLRSATPSTTTPSTTTIASAPATDAPSPDVPTEPPAEASDEGQSVSSTPFGVADGSSYAEWVVPWKDGFLAGGTVYQPQPLPTELPPEVVELFPPEVVALFADGLPGTINEATEMLTGAGLLEEVLAVIADHPEASDAIYSAGSGPSQVVVQFTVDGETWSAVDVTLPDGVTGLHQVTVAGDRLVTVDSPQNPGSTSIIVASTTDLSTWETTTIEVQRPAEVPAEVRVNVWPSAIAANASRWVLGVTVATDVDLLQFLPDGAAEAMRSAAGGYSTGADGVRVEMGPDAGGEYETVNYTWAELGIDEQVVGYIDGPPTSEIWAAPFGGVPEKSDLDATFVADVVATPDRFLLSMPQFLSSTDGLTWTEVNAPVERVFTTAATPADDGLVVFTSAVEGGGQAYLVDPSLSDWTLVDIPGVPPHISSMLNERTGAPAIIIDASPPQYIEQSISFEADGFRLTRNSSDVSSVVSYELVDLASGAIVLSESVDLQELADGDYVGTGPFANVTYSDDGGITIVDPASGELLVAIPQDVVEQAYDDTFAQIDVGEQEYRPDLWLIAYKGSNGWLVDDLSDATDLAEGYYGPPATAINGDTLLVAVNGEWLIYDLGS